MIGRSRGGTDANGRWRFGWLLRTALLIVAGLLALAAVVPWFKVLVPSWTRIWLLVRALDVLEFVYLGAWIGGLVGTLILGSVCYRAGKSGARRAWAARGLLACLSSLFGLILADLGAASWKAMTQQPPVSSESAAPRQRGPELPSQFMDSPDDPTMDLVVVGESSAEGQPCQEWLSVGQIVTWQLQQVLPDQHFRLHVLAHGGDTLENQQEALAQLAYRPEALILYCGHNEFASRYAWSRLVDYYLDEQSSGSRPLGESLGRISPFCRLIREVSDLHRISLTPPPKIGRHLIDEPAYSASEAVERLADFRQRLEIIVSFCERVGALPILVIPSANDAGFEPNRSYLSPETPRAERVEFAREFRAARALEKSDPAESLRRYRAALARHPEFAEAHFRVARLLEHTGQWEKAYREYIAARDRDGLPMRCFTRFQEAIRQVAHRHGCLLIDGQALFHAIGPHGLLNDYLFHDMMHPSVRGHIALAQAILNAIQARHALGWPTDSPAPRIEPTACAAHFGIDTEVWATLCHRGAAVYHAVASLRYDTTERTAKSNRFLQAARRIETGTPPEEAGIPSIGIPPSEPRSARTKPEPVPAA